MMDKKTFWCDVFLRDQNPLVLEDYVSYDIRDGILRMICEHGEYLLSPHHWTGVHIYEVETDDAE